ncbi:amidase [Azohydromonas lata]|uniref:Amidase n=1 Tax=Azohydromonas lata TaxID=45677 RepID=A0ABU5IB34_9BURK|nr:amidase [Azohydromonas lata]MDZ5456310.1 amidase [Azohydromonas lata]
MKLGLDAPDAVSIRTALLEGRLRAEDVARAAMERIAALEPRLRAWEVFDPALALAQARGVDRRMAANEVPGLLAGVPLAVKDIFDTADLPTGHGSPIYRGHRPGADAQAVAAARAAGAVVMGKTVTTEFAYFTPGPTANPWNPHHTPGGSSSGSAAAVASGMVPLAFGSQTAGSLIRPASYCGVFALKPTHGAFSLAGVKPFAPSLDTLGWLARTADDLELMRCALAGQPWAALERRPPRALRLGVCRTHEGPALDAGGLEAWNRGLARLEAAGVPLRRLDMPPDLAGLVQVQKTVMAWEAARSLAPQWRAHRPQLSRPLAELIQAGLDTPDSRYEEALAQAARGRQAVALLMRDVDALLVPAASGEAPRGLAATGDPVFSRVWTLLGLPCANVPGLLGPTGLPVGLQLVGHRDQERALLEAAACVHGAIA